MKKYSVSFNVGCSWSKKVVAKSKEEAIDKCGLAPSLCHFCSENYEIGEVLDVEDIIELGEATEEDYDDEE